MQKNAFAVLCTILATVQAYDGENTRQFQQAFPQPQGYGAAVQRYKRFKHPISNNIEPADLIELEAHLNSDTKQVPGEVEGFNRLLERPNVAPNNNNLPLSSTDNQNQENLRRQPSHLRSPVAVPRGFATPRITWPAFNIPTQKIIPKQIMNELIAAVLQEIMIRQIKQALYESDEKPQDLASMGKRATTQLGIIATKMIVHQMVRAVMFSYLGPLGIIVAEEALYSLGEYIAKKVIKRMKKREERRGALMLNAKEQF